MCGLLGVIGGDPSQFSKNQFLQALSQLHHRGPDESGYCWQPGKHMVALGHHRLRIIDLNAHSAQPMYSQDGRYTIVFNGEIYNYLELKQGLLKEGYQFRTGSDTEVLLVCFERYGIECVSKLLGMFAFAIYDNISAELWMARDRLGIKPLYYQYKNESIYFASEVKGILPFMEDVPSLNLEAVSSYLSFRYPIMDDSFFQGIQSIPAGHYLNFSVKQKKIVIQEYWDVSGCIAAQSIDHGESVYLEQLDELLDSAVKYRMIADVPVGAYLSGGVDSSVVTALMSKFCNHSVKTYTIGFSEEGYSEFNYAKMVAKQYATDHCEVVLTGD